VPTYKLPSPLISTLLDAIRIIALPVILLSTPSNAIGQQKEDVRILAWEFNKNNLHGKIIATMHGIPKSSISTKDAIVFRRKLRKIVENSDHIHLERPLKSKINLSKYDKEAYLPNDIKEKIEKSTIYPYIKDMNVYKKPAWAIAFIISKIRNDKINKNAALHGTELEIIRIATEKSTPIHGLEESNVIFNNLNNLPIKSQYYMIETSLIDDESYKKNIETYAETYLDSNHTNLCSTIEKSLIDRDYWENIVTNRNKNWMSKINQFDDNYSHLVAIGAAHTCGSESIINLMKSYGFQIRRIF
jgi:uncharacterized protein YbaP (TraB family)